jgi:DNA-binding protein HU-beta
MQKGPNPKTGKVESIIKITLKISMNKQGLVELVHGKLGGTKVQAEEIVDSMFDAIISTMKKGGEVSVAGFGIFSVKGRAARMARNPKTGEQVKVAAKKVPKFRAAKALKDAVA